MSSTPSSPPSGGRGNPTLSGHLELLAEELNCSLCLDYFVDPVVLPCQHSFCRECIRGAVKQSSLRFEVECPLCRKKAVLQGTTADACVVNLPRNFQLAGIIEKFQATKAEKGRLEELQYERELFEQMELSREQEDRRPKQDERPQPMQQPPEGPSQLSLSQGTSSASGSYHSGGLPSCKTCSFPGVIRCVQCQHSFCLECQQTHSHDGAATTAKEGLQPETFGKTLKEELREKLLQELRQKQQSLELEVGQQQAVAEFTPSLQLHHQQSNRWEELTQKQRHVSASEYPCQLEGDASRHGPLSWPLGQQDQQVYQQHQQLLNRPEPQQQPPQGYPAPHSVSSMQEYQQEDQQVYQQHQQLLNRPEPQQQPPQGYPAPHSVSSMQEYQLQDQQVYQQHQQLLNRPEPQQQQQQPPQGYPAPHSDSSMQEHQLQFSPSSLKSQFSETGFSPSSLKSQFSETGCTHCHFPASTHCQDCLAYFCWQCMEERHNPRNEQFSNHKMVELVASLSSPSSLVSDQENEVADDSISIPPSFPKVHKIPYTCGIEGMAPGKRITVLGQPNQKCSRFHINLMCNKNTGSGDIALHFNPRFAFHKTVVRNSRIGKKYGAEERGIPRFPFAAGRSFKIEFVCLLDKFEVWVDNKLFIAYAHRIKDLRSIKFLHINGDMEITSVGGCV